MDYTECMLHSECFSNKEGKCTILKNTIFDNRDCPFFKINRDDIRRTLDDENDVLISKMSRSF